MRDDLRARAEALVKKSKADAAALTPREVQELFHELQVHQAELEMQNEELRRTQQELTVARDRHAALYQSIPVGCLTIDARRAIRSANKAAEAMFDGEDRHLAGRRLDAFVVPEDVDACYLHLRRAADTKSRQRGDIRFRRGDGSVFWADMEIVPAQRPDDSTDFLVTLNDITERKRDEVEIRLYAEELRARNAELNRFNEVAVGRELRMIELKKEVNALCEMAGLPKRYDVEFENNAANSRG